MEKVCRRTRRKMRARSLTLVFAVAAIVAVLAGCGQKGDLYLPPPQERPDEKARD